MVGENFPSSWRIETFVESIKKGRSMKKIIGLSALFYFVVGRIFAQDFTMGDSLAFRIIAEGEVGIATGSRQVKGRLVIPDSVTFGGETYAVTSVGYMVDGSPKGFGYSNGLKEVTMPNTVRNINHQAFVRCGSLQHVKMSDSVETVGFAAFGLCTNLKSVKFGPKLRSIDREGFYNCTSFDSLHIPASLVSVGQQAFSGCGFVHIEVDETNPRYASESGVWYNKQKDTLLRYPPQKPGGRFTVPSSVVCIGETSFTDAANLLEVTFPENLKSIGIAAFLTSGLGSVQIPNSVEYIGYNAFNGCRGLTEVQLGNSLRYIGSGCFYYCDKLESIELPESLVYLGGAAFERTGLTSEVKIPASVTFVGDGAFEDCDNLEYIIVHENNINYSSAQGILYNKAKDTLLFCPRGRNGDVVLEEGLRHIGRNAFGNCEKLNSVEMPNSVESLGYWAFQRCKTLTEVVMSESVTWIDTSCFSNCHKIKTMSLPPEIEYIAPYAFEYCKAWKGEIVLPNTLAGIGNNVFYGCDSIERIIFPKDMEVIPAMLLGMCSSLDSVKWPENLKVIGVAAFMGCSSLREVVFPETLESIGERCFTNAKNLQRIVFPATIGNIGTSVFYGCKALSDIVCKNPVPPQTGSNVFGSCPDTVVLTVPCGAAADYAEASEWNTIANVEEELFYDLHLTVNDTSMGTAMQTGEIPACEHPELTLLAQPRAGYYFVQWSDGSKENPHTMPVEGGFVEIQAEFAPVPPSLFVITWDFPEGGRIAVTCGDTAVNSGMALDSGSVLTLKAEALDGYDFVQWWDGNTEPERVYELKSDIAISAEFSRQEYVLTIEQAEGGTITVTCGGETLVSGASVEYGSVLKLKAMAADGYVFEAWWDGNTEEEREIEMKEALKVSATFKKKAGNEKSNELKGRIYPNPSDGLFTVELTEAARIEVYGMAGKKLYEKECAFAGCHEVDLRGKASGMLVFRVIFENGLATQRVIVR